MRKLIDPSPTALDLADFPCLLDCGDEVLFRLGAHGHLVITDHLGKTFPGFLIWSRWGAFIVRGPGNAPHGTYVSIKAAIRWGRAGPATHDDTMSAEHSVS